MTVPAAPRPLVLVVEDSRDLREAVALILKHEGYRTVSVADGLQALDVSEREQPDLILLDYSMPRLDGAGFCRAYRERGGEAPVVLMTAALRVTIEDAQKLVVECGAAAFITKPFAVDELLETVDRCVTSPTARREWP